MPNQMQEIHSATTTTETITDFSDFTKVADTQYIESENYISSVNFSYHGSEAPSNSLEMFKFTVEDEKNVSDFWVEAKVEYYYLIDQDTGGFGYCIGPNRLNPIEIVFDSKSVDLYHESGSDYVTYEVAALPFGKKESYLANSTIPMKLNDTVIFHAQRIDGNLTLSIKEIGTEKTLLTKHWFEGVSDPVNAVALAFQVGGTSNFNISTYGISGELTIVEDLNNTSIPFSIPSFLLQESGVISIFSLIGVVMILNFISKKKK